MIDFGAGEILDCIKQVEIVEADEVEDGREWGNLRWRMK